jgi:Leucine-rich repeat (LRR) protein
MSDAETQTVRPQTRKRLPSPGCLFGLGGTRITDTGLQHLSGLTNLQVLDLVNTPITDVGLRHLDGLTALANLDLGNTRVTHSGVEMLRARLPACSIVFYVEPTD